VQGRAPTLVGGRRRWRLRTGERTDALRSSDYPPLLQRLLANRGVRTLDEARRFLKGEPAPPDPFLLPDMERAVQRLRLALSRRELVAVFADFDVDGVTAAALLTQGLEALGGHVLAYIPDRFREGYGLNTDAIDRLRAQGADLLLTADCGSSSVAEVEHARTLGMDVLILDHHAVPEQLPPAQALVNPRLWQKELGTGNREPGASPKLPVRGSLGELAAVGLAYQLMAALHEALNAAFEPDEHLDLVALGTVVDMVPLLGENREMVRRGLAALARTRHGGRPGLRALMKVAGVASESLDTEALSFALGPRLNAAGRLANARLAYDLLVAGDEEEAARLAQRLDDLNRERQRQTLDALSLAQELLSADDPTATGSPLVMLGHPALGSGIVGLVAARLAEELYRPAVVYELGESVSRASARSIPEFDIVGALRRCARLFQRFGGHRQAAGFTADNQALPAIKERLLEQAALELAPLDLAPTIEVDAPMPLRALRAAEIQGLGLLGPHGIGNPRPTFLSRGVTVLECQAVGSDGQHLRLKVRDGPMVWPAIAFGMGEGRVESQEPARPASGLPEPGSLIDVVYAFSADRRGGDKLELEVLDFLQSP
jgi:single-stranded-DNA-specific exonuclease